MMCYNDSLSTWAEGSFLAVYLDDLELLDVPGNWMLNCM